MCDGIVGVGNSLGPWLMCYLHLLNNIQIKMTVY